MSFYDRLEVLRAYIADYAYWPLIALTVYKLVQGDWHEAALAFIAAHVALIAGYLMIIRMNTEKG